nr:TetR/AcrR family transcriptional regulator [Shuttleworthia satelles]
MADRSYETTHRKILESARECFLQKGYERTNLRALCEKAGLTTGAFYRHFEDKSAVFTELVDGAAQGLLAKFDLAEEECFDFIDVGHMDEIWDVSVETISEFIRYIYRHFDEFKLILSCSGGTKYSNYIDWLVEREQKSNERMFQVLDEKGIPYRHVASDELHVILHAYYTCIFETVLHDFSRDKALESTRSLSEFFSAGWRKLLQI